MKIDFWNNPLVVSSMRVRYRRGGLFNLTTIYLLILVAGGAVLAYYNHVFGGPWPRNYLLAMLGLQFFVFGLLAGGATAASMRAEVADRTLDFQRIAALSPQQILLGKLLGEPAIAYLLPVSSIPLAVYCWLLGVPGLSLAALVLLYLLLLTNTILIGSLGLLQQVEPPASKASAAASGGNWGWAWLALAVLLVASGQSSLASPRSAAIVGLLTPAPALFGLYSGAPWRYALSFYGLQIPFLLVTPVAQLALAFLCFRLMSRRLLNPLNTSLGKPTAYLTLLLIDLLAAGALTEPTPLGLPIVQRCVAFSLVHLTVCYLLLGSVTPMRDTLLSWIWRYRGRSSRVWDLGVGDRSENGLALVTFCAIGILGLLLLVVWPAAGQEGVAAVQAVRTGIGSILLVTTLLVLSLGTLYQWCVFVAGRTGRAAFTTIVALMVVPYHLLGVYYHSQFLLSLTPSALFGAWMFESPSPSLLPLVIEYGALLVLSWFSLRRLMGRAQKAIDRKLEGIGAKPAPA